ncbi:MAG: hypothetical protein HKN42_13190 [Granulosicoccus sp.]|nr:hypothetical protein [Granulosicoccus sp.]
MKNGGDKVTLLVPGFSPEAGGDRLQWADGLPPQPWQGQLSVLLGQAQWDGVHLPAAELSVSSQHKLRQVDPSPGGQGRVCADPIHLRADRDTATLIPGGRLALTDAEADELLSAINTFLHADGLRFSRLAADRWFMSGMDGRALSSYPPSFLAHRNASAFLPGNDETGAWRRLMTELQMLLHAHPVNAERERQGRLPVNSVWFWGGASLQSAVAVDERQRQSTLVHADANYAVALADALGLKCLPLERFQPQAIRPATVILDTRVVDALFAGDETGMAAAEQQILDDWIVPLLARRQSGAAVELEIHTEDGLAGRPVVPPPGHLVSLWARLTGQFAHRQR